MMLESCYQRCARGLLARFMLITSSQALNKGEKPAIIADRIDVRALDMGSIVCCLCTAATAY